MPVYSSHLLRYEDLHIGARIRKERLRRDWTLKQLAARVGVSAAWLSEWENERHVIDLAQAFDLARALEIPLAALMPPDVRIPYQIAREPDVLARPPGDTRLATFQGGASVRHNSEFWPLADLFISRHLEPQLGRIHPVQRLDLQSCHHEEEFIFVLRGIVELQVKTPQGVCREEIGRGDSLCFRSDFPHSLRSLDQQPAETIHVFGAGAGAAVTALEWTASQQGGHVDDRESGNSLDQVGARLRVSRDLHGWTLGQVAEIVGLSARQLEQVERGERGVPLDVLLRLAKVFGRALAEVVGQSPAQGPYYFIQRAEAIEGVPKRRRRTPVEKPDAPPSKTCQPLASGFPVKCMFPCLLRILNVDAETLTLHEHHGQEFIYVLDGEIELITYAEEHRVNEILRAGDSCYLDSTVPHLLRGRTRNPFSQTSAEVIDVFWSPLGERYLFDD
jgi:transcriptional regulator with XRE-family HTH domain